MPQEFDVVCLGGGVAGEAIAGGLKDSGLVHISQLANRFVKDPNEIVRVAQQVEVTVMEVDLARKRIALSMRRYAE